MKLTEKQRRFCREYSACGSAKEAALAAGYSESSARNQGYRNLQVPAVQEEIRRLQKAYEDSLTMDAEEMRRRLTAIARGETLEEEVMTVGTGQGCTEVQSVDRKVSTKDQLKAMDQLARMGGFYDNTLSIKAPDPIVIAGSDDLAD